MQQQRGAAAPKPGEEWRINFSRVQWLHNWEGKTAPKPVVPPINDHYDQQPPKPGADDGNDVQHLLPGDSVGYGSTFVADRAMRIGVVACGYADGYPRSAPSGTPVCVDGLRSETVGRVSMDMITVDITDLPHADVGSEVTLWGMPQKSKAMTQPPLGVAIDEVAQAAGTVGYELMCALAPRVPAVVKD